MLCKGFVFKTPLKQMLLVKAILIIWINVSSAVTLHL